MRRTWRSASVLVLLALVAVGTQAARKDTHKTAEAPWPQLMLDGGRSLTYQQTLMSEQDVKNQPGFWGKVVNLVAGNPTIARWRGLTALP